MLIREYKKEDIDAVTKVHIDTWNDSYKDILPKKYLSERTYENQKEKWRDRLFCNKDTKEFMFIAENNDGEVVGFATGALNSLGNKFDSRVYTLYILKDYQNKGVGKLLIKAVASKLESLGAKNMVLSAFMENKACKFYEHLGGIQGEKNRINIMGYDLIEVDYEWEDISYLA